MSERERENFIALFTCVAAGDGDVGARLMLERSPEQHCNDVPGFMKDMKQVFERVSPRSLNLSDIDVSEVMQSVLNTMQHHKVRIDMNFASLLATVVIGEGLGRRLTNGEFNMFETAMPFLLKCLKSHEMSYMIERLQEAYLLGGR
jgi:aarF domain-containing kinase